MRFNAVLMLFVVSVGVVIWFVVDGGVWILRLDLLGWRSCVDWLFGFAVVGIWICCIFLGWCLVLVISCYCWVCGYCVF